MTYRELHALRTGSSKLTADYHLTTFRTALHDEPQHTVTCPPHGQTVQQLVAERFTLCDRRETAILDFGSIERDGVFGELESFLDQRGQFADAAPLLAKDLLCVCCADDYRIKSAETMLHKRRRDALISVTVGVTRTSTPEYPSSANSRWKNSFNSA